MLNHDTQLFSHHIDDDKLWEFSDPTAAVTQHPTNPNVWGLKNLETHKWVSTAADGTARDVEPQVEPHAKPVGAKPVGVEPGKSVSLAIGTRINFGKMEGEIRA